MVATSQDYQVDLDIYNGPLDLLLYLIRREEIDIYDIPIARITAQYLEHMEVLKAMDLGVVGDFLVMAATLMEIKSRMLLPVQEDGEEGEEEDDPRMELVRQLIEYKRFKDAAAALSMWGKEQDQRFPRPGELDAFGGHEEQQEFEEEYELWHLVEAFAKLMQQTGMGVEGTVVYDDTPIHEYMRLIMDLLEKHTVMSFFELFALRRGKSAMTGCFLALLELVKQHHVRVEQVREHGDIVLAIRRPDQEATRRETVREFVALPLRGAARRVRLQRPMTTTAYQRRARRQIMTVPARRRTYRASIVSIATTPALRVDAAADPPPPAIRPAVPLPPETARPLISDEIAEVEVIDVRDVEFEAPDGWEAPPPFEPERLALRRPLAREAGRRQFVPRLPRGYRIALPRRRNPLTAWAVVPPLLAEAPVVAPLPDLAESQRILPMAPAPPTITGGDTELPAEIPGAPVRPVHHPPARGKGRKLFRPEYPRTRQLVPPNVASEPVTPWLPAQADITAPVVQGVPLADLPTPTRHAVPVPRPKAPASTGAAPSAPRAPSKSVAEVARLPADARILTKSGTSSPVPARPRRKSADLTEPWSAPPEPLSDTRREDTGLVFRAYARGKGRRRYQPESRAYCPQLPRVRHLTQHEASAPGSGERFRSWLMALWNAIKRFAAMLWRRIRGLLSRWRGPRE